MGVVVACQNCGKEIVRSPSLVRKQTFCSRDCRKTYAHRMKVCLGCGVEFPRNPKEPNRQYCTWECFKASRHLTEVCFICGKEFTSYLSEHNRRIKNAHVPCCSRACRNVYTSRLLGGDGTWVEGGKYARKRRRSKEWRKIRAVYLKSFGGICEGCEGVPAVNVHHLYPTAGGGEELDFDNLMAVCKDCHDIMHKQLREGAFWSSYEGVAFDAQLED
jgi:5-methylcytosine-specific restriction endonuclease McrA